MEEQEKKLLLVERRFKYWRSKRKHRDKIPIKLLEAAKSLYPENSIGKICNRLKLGYSTLKECVDPGKRKKKKSSRVSKRDRTFIEIPLSRASTIGRNSEEISFINQKGIKLCLQNVIGNEDILKECLQLYFMGVR